MVRREAVLEAGIFSAEASKLPMCFPMTISGKRGTRIIDLTY